MTRLELDDKPALMKAIAEGRLVFEPDGESRRRVNWTAVGVVSAIVIAVLSWLSAGAGDYRNVGDRVLTLETLRQQDSQRMERIENKIDRLLEVRK